MQDSKKNPIEEEIPGGTEESPPDAKTEEAENTDETADKLSRGDKKYKKTRGTGGRTREKAI
jgi:hypothetical protein